jgi:hypothetical protein
LRRTLAKDNPLLVTDIARKSTRSRD